MIFPKRIVKPWEELKFNRNRHGLGYEKDIKFYIPNYSKPIQFVGADFLADSKNIVNTKIPEKC
jgi:hypothetical protein